MYYSETAIKQLSNSYAGIDTEYQSLLELYAFRKFSDRQADEYAKHGFMRRVGILARCIHNIYRVCPPEQSKKLSKDELSDLTINLQSFIFNVFGCLDNLACVWVKEKSIKNSKNEPLENREIGFSKKYKSVRKSFSKGFRDYLKGLDKWFLQMENFRHALAHRIPLYVPPYVVNKEEAAQELELEKLRNDALKRHDFEGYETISEKLYSIGKFIPCMTHSFSEQSRQIEFHAQIIADWNTVVEISKKFLKELQ